MIYDKTDTQELLSATVPTKFLEKFQSDTLQVTFAQLQNKTIRRNIAKLLLTVSIDVRIVSGEYDQLQWLLYSTCYSDGTRYINIVKETVSIAPTYRFSVLYDRLGEMRFTSPALPCEEFKQLFLDIYTTALSL